MRVQFLNPTETQDALLMTNATLSVVACTLVRVHVGKTGTAAAARAFEHELPASHYFDDVAYFVFENYQIAKNQVHGGVPSL